MSVLALLALVAISAQEKPPESLIPVPSWDLWQNSAAGSSVTLEVEIAGKKTRKIVTLKEKTASRMTFEEIVDVDGKRRPATERVLSKPAGSPGVYDTVGVSGDCKECKKPWKDHKPMERIPLKEKRTIGQAEVACEGSESISFGCDGKESVRTKFSYSDDVPGELVRKEFRDKTTEYTITCLAFVKK
ncbi:MAG TPA: hypothetical protein VNM14_14510 [Planctomycetota bacterium]|nr:hypothetical protein [Planctomycetota bacterium]